MHRIVHSSLTDHFHHPRTVAYVFKPISSSHHPWLSLISFQLPQFCFFQNVIKLNHTISSPWDDLAAFSQQNAFKMYLHYVNKVCSFSLLSSIQLNGFSNHFLVEGCWVFSLMSHAFNVISQCFLHKPRLPNFSHMLSSSNCIVLFYIQVYDDQF